MIPSSANVTASTAFVVGQHRDERRALARLRDRPRRLGTLLRKRCDLVLRPVVRRHLVADFSRFAAMPAPMFPSPMNPIFMPTTMPGVSVGARDLG